MGQTTNNNSPEATDVVVHQLKKKAKLCDFLQLKAEKEYLESRLSQSALTIRELEGGILKLREEQVTSDTLAARKEDYLIATIEENQKLKNKNADLESRLSNQTSKALEQKEEFIQEKSQLQEEFIQEKSQLQEELFQAKAQLQEEVTINNLFCNSNH